MATAWAPPTAYTSSMPSMRQTARTVGCTSPPASFRGGLASAIASTPATWAATAFMITDDG